MRENRIRSLGRTALAILSLGASAACAAATPAQPPLYFEPNRGQADPSVSFLARGEGYGLYLTDDGAVFRLRRPAPDVNCEPCSAANPGHRPEPEYAAVRMRLAGARLASPARGEGPLPGRSRYLRLEGGGPVESRDVPHYRAVRREGVYPGVDLVVYGRDRRIEYDFVVAPGADPDAIRLEFEGAGVRLERGALVLETPAGRLVQHTPVLYQEVNGRRRPVAGRYVRRGESAVGFAVERYDRSRPLVIDPVLSFSTFLGGSGWDDGRGVNVDRDGNILVVGRTDSPNFPNVNQPPQEGPFPGTYDAFIAKYSPDGTQLIYSIYVGSEGSDAAEDVKTDVQGNAYITGGYNGDMFVLKLGPDGSEKWGYLYGGSSNDAGLSLALDAQGSLYVTGETESWDYDGTPDVWEGFPVTLGAIGTNRNGSGDAFVCKIAPDGATLLYSTYLGGDESFLGEKGRDIAVDGQGNAYVAGETASASFPGANTGLQTEHGGWLADGFLAKINPTGTAILYATYLGGDDFDAAYGVALDRDGFAYVTGATYSTGFPVSANAFQKEWHISDCNPDPFRICPCLDAFVTKIATDRTGDASMVYSTYFGWHYSDYAHDIAVDAAGRAVIVGQALTVEFPEKDPLPTAGLVTDAFVTQFNADGSDILFSTRIGGDGWDVGDDITLGPNGDIYVTGWTDSGNFPRAQPYQHTIGGGTYDAFVARIALTGGLPPGDANGDGTFDMADVLLAVRIAGGLAPGGEGAARADVAEPAGQVTVQDALVLLKRLRGE